MLTFGEIFLTCSVKTGVCLLTLQSLLHVLRWNVGNNSFLFFFFFRSASLLAKRNYVHCARCFIIAPGMHSRHLGPISDGKWALINTSISLSWGSWLFVLIISGEEVFSLSSNHLLDDEYVVITINWHTFRPDVRFVLRNSREGPLMDAVWEIVSQHTWYFIYLHILINMINCGN